MFESLPAESQLSWPVCGKALSRSKAVSRGRRPMRSKSPFRRRSRPRRGPPNETRVIQDRCARYADRARWRASVCTVLSARAARRPCSGAPGRRCAGKQNECRQTFSGLFSHPSTGLLGNTAGVGDRGRAVVTVTCEPNWSAPRASISGSPFRPVLPKS